MVVNSIFEQLPVSRITDCLPIAKWAGMKPTTDRDQGVSLAGSKFCGVLAAASCVITSKCSVRGARARMMRRIVRIEIEVLRAIIAPERGNFQPVRWVYVKPAGFAGIDL